MAKTRVVTISHATGAGGDNIGRGVAKGLGFRYVDEEIIELAAERHGVDPELVADAERRKSVLDRILDDMATTPMITMMIEMTIATIGRLIKNLAMTIYLDSFFAAGFSWAGAPNGLGVTIAPGRTFWVPSATTLSPGFSPVSTIHCVPTRSPTLAGRISTVLLLFTTAT